MKIKNKTKQNKTKTKQKTPSKNNVVYSVIMIFPVDTSYLATEHCLILPIENSFKTEDTNQSNISNF